MEVARDESISRSVSEKSLASVSSISSRKTSLYERTTFPKVIIKKMFDKRKSWVVPPIKLVHFFILEIKLMCWGKCMLGASDGKSSLISSLLVHGVVDENPTLGTVKK